MRTLLRLELQKFIRNRGLLTGFAIVLLFGIYGIYYGNNIISKQRHNLDAVKTLENNYINTLIEQRPDTSIGHEIYYAFFYSYNYPQPWASFAIGQRDVLNYNIKAKILALEGQIYDNELTNPLSLQVGNLDLSFVFIYLLPLLIIALSFNLISEERENGVWAILRTQRASVLGIIWGKLLVRYLAVILLIVVLLFGAMLIFQSADWRIFAQILGITWLYISFWFALLWFINSWGFSSSFNAIMAISIWIVLCVLMPALGNVWINTRTPVPESLETALIQRQAYHEKWDMPKHIVMEQFYQEYPEYRKYKVPEKIYYHSGWYYAMQYVADKAAKQASQALEAKLLSREQQAICLGYFLPSLGLQQSYNALVNTGLQSQIDYLHSVRKYHQNIREFFYPYIFEEYKTKNVPWDKRPRYQSPIEKAEIPYLSLIFMALFTIVLTLSGIARIKKM